MHVSKLHFFPRFSSIILIYIFLYLDPEKLLNDPRANDQDADPRILDAVKNGFAKNKGRWKN